MAVNKTQITELSGTWDGNSPNQKDFDQLNQDFEEMEIPLKAMFESSPDGWIIKVIKEENN